MLHIPTWSRVTTFLILFLGFLIALPNALPNSVLAKFPRFLPTSTVTLGLETATKYEVLSGVKEGDLVLIGDTGQLKPGEKVEPKLVNLLAAQ